MEFLVENLVEDFGVNAPLVMEIPKFDQIILNTYNFNFLIFILFLVRHQGTQGEMKVIYGLFLDWIIS